MSNLLRKRRLTGLAGSLVTASVLALATAGAASAFSGGEKMFLELLAGYDKSEEPNIRHQSAGSACQAAPGTAVGRGATPL